MEERNEILNLLKLSGKPVVPENFFSEFEEKLMREISSSLFTLDQLQKRNKPNLPAGYFDELEPTVEKVNFELQDLQKSKTPELPDSYFDSLEKQLVDAPRVKKFARIKWLSLAGSIAAAFVIFFSVYNNQSHTNSTTNNTANHAVNDTVVNDENINETLLTLLDEDDLIEFIISNDVEIEDSSAIDENEFSDYSTEEIEEYYLELL